MKYRPDYPEQFDNLDHARNWARAFFTWYNHEHHHTGLGLMTPAIVHFGQAGEVRAKRQQVLDEAYASHPERFFKGRPIAADVPTQVWINPPQSATVTGAAPVEALSCMAVTVVTGPTKTDNGTRMAVDEEMLRPAEKEKYSAPKKCSLFPSGEFSQKA